MDWFESVVFHFFKLNMYVIVSNYIVAPPPFRCQFNEWECPDGLRVCIDRTKVCDGNPDCPEGHDESPVCSKYSALHTEHTSCFDKIRILKHGQKYSSRSKYMTFFSETSE